MLTTIRGPILAFILTLLGETTLFGQSQLALSSGAAASGSSAALNLTLASVPGSEPAAVAWVFTYDPNAIASIAATAGPSLTAANKTLTCVGSAGTYSCFASGVNNSSIASGVVANVSVALTANSTSAPIAIASASAASVGGALQTVAGTSGTVTISTSQLSGISCSPASLGPGANSLCTVGLTGPVAVSTVLGLTSSGSVTAPASTTIAAGASSGAFNVAAGSFTTNQTATISAGWNGTSVSTNLSLIAPAQVSSLQCASVTLAASSSTSCTVTLANPAPAGGATVSLSSSNSSALSVPLSLTIAASSSTTSFTATASAVTSDQTAGITASLGGVSRSVTLNLVAPITISALQCASTSIPASSSTTCTVTISKEAPAGGSTVSLSSGAASSLSVPASVTVAQAGTTASFSAAASAVTSDQTVIVSAGLNGSSRSASITVVAPVSLLSLACAASSVAASSSTNCTVTLSKAAPSGGVTVLLSSSASSSLAVPSSVSISQGSSSASFMAKAGAVTADQSVTITATLNGVSQSFSVNVTAPVTISSLQCPSSSVVSLSSTQCNVILSKAAPAGGITVALSSSAGGVLSVPSSVAIAAGSTSGVFTAVAGSITSNQSVTLTATLNGSSKTLTIKVTAAPFSLTCAASTLAPGATTLCTIVLSSAANGNGSTVALSSSDPSAVTVPASAFIARRSVSTTFTATAKAVTTSRRANIVATFGSFSASFAISVVSPIAPLTSSDLQLRCEPRQLAPGDSAVCEISYPGDPGGSTPEFTITSSSGTVRVPAAVRARAGRSALRFEVDVDKAAASGDVSIDANTDRGDARTSLFVLRTAPIRIIVPGPITAEAGTTVSFTVETSNALGLPVSLRIAEPPAGATFDPQSGQFAWTTTDRNRGVTELVFTASDSLGSAATEKIKVSVVPSGPVLSRLRNAAGSQAAAGCTPGGLATLDGTGLARPEHARTVRVLVNGLDAPVVRGSAESIDFLCPALPAGVALSLAVERDGMTSEELHSAMLQNAPGLLSIDGSGQGAALAYHSQKLAALPRFDRDGMPAIRGDAISVFATGIDCDSASASRLSLRLGSEHQRITHLSPSAAAGVCEVRTVIPDATSGLLEITLEVALEDGSVVQSNSIRIDVER